MERLAGGEGGGGPATPGSPGSETRRPISAPKQLPGHRGSLRCLYRVVCSPSRVQCNGNSNGAKEGEKMAGVVPGATGPWVLPMCL